MGGVGVMVIRRCFQVTKQILTIFSEIVFYFTAYLKTIRRANTRLKHTYVLVFALQQMGRKRYLANLRINSRKLPE